MVAVATTCPVWTADQWAQRILKTFPRRWSASNARKTGAIMYAFFNAVGSQLSFLQEDVLLYVFNATRVATAEDVSLDAIGEGYFGETRWLPPFLQRANGESDASYRARIQAEIFSGGTTRARIAAAITRLVGTAPRIIEPWSVVDCASLDTVSYADIDTVANPGRISDSGMRATIFIESLFPPFDGQFPGPIWGLDFGLGADFGYDVEPSPTWFSGTYELDQLIRLKRACGVAAYRRYQQDSYLTYPIAGSIFVPEGATSVQVLLYPGFNEPYAVVAQPSWNTFVGVTQISGTLFELTFSAAAPTSLFVDWMAGPVTDDRFGLIQEPAGATGDTFEMPISGQPFVTAEWPSVVSLTGISDGDATLEFDVAAAEQGSICYGMIPPSSSGTQSVITGATTATVTPDTLPTTYQAFVMPSWDTTCAVNKSSGSFSMTFGTAAPADAFFTWGFFTPEGI